MAMSATKRSAGPSRVALAVFAGATALLLLGHSGIQAVGAVGYWQPCWSEGYGSDICAYLQYEAPVPDWIAPIWVWLIEVGFAATVLGLATATRSRIVVASLALSFVLASSIVVDYVLTPAVNGGYVSADSPPGAGLVGATAMAAGGAFAAVAALPRRGAPSPAARARGR